MPATPSTTPAIPDLASAMMPLDGTDPALPSSDLELLREIVGDARVVGLGESTHGQREVFQLKHRIIQYVVAEPGFTTFALEASVVGCRNMSRFVRTGEGDPEAAVKGQGYWTWSTEEVLELILWLRQWNIAHPDRPVDVAGIDTQEAWNAYHELSLILGNNDPQLVLDYVSELSAIADLMLGASPYNAPLHRQFIETLDAMEPRIKAMPGASEEDIALALDDILAMRQFLELWSAPMAQMSTVRDRIMTERTAALATATPDARVALWAHNAHVAKSRSSYWGTTRTVPMGLNLKARFVDDYVIVGFLFGSGGYQGVQEQPSGTYELTSGDVGPPPEGSLDAALYAASPAPVSVLDLHHLPGPIRDWLAAEWPVRQAGALLLESDEMLIDVNVIQTFDVIAFIRETTAAIPLD